MEKLCLEVQDLTKRYDASEFSLDHLNFKVPYGSVMGLIGENGAGKTTTLKLILNLMRRDAGTIKLFGLDNIRDEGAIKQQIGVVFDENHFHELFSPADIAKILRSLYQKWDDNLFQQYLRRFQLPADKPIKTYSRGMKVKLSIASPLAHHPKLLLLDEPTSGLDPVVRDEILSIFFDFIQDEEHTILMSSHITGDLEKIADYVTFLHQGRLVFSGVKDDLLDSHGIVKCNASERKRIDPKWIVKQRTGPFGCEILVNNKAAVRHLYPELLVDNASLEEIMLFHVKGEK